MNRTIKNLFFILVELFFLLSILSCVYFGTSWRKDNYQNYLPEHRIYPQYDLATGEVTNKDEVTFWSDDDFVPTFNMIVESFFNWFMGLWNVLFSLFLIFIFPVYYFTSKNNNIWHWVLVYYQLLMIAVMVLAWI